MVLNSGGSANPGKGYRTIMVIQSANFITSAPSLAACPASALPEIAFAGRSNVGKSSLINTLLNRKGLVRTSSTPGRTQMLNFFAINENLHFVDLPGYGFAKAPRAVRERWQPMIRDYLAGRANLRAVVWLLDVRREPSDEDLRFLDWLEETERPTIPVITKVDKFSRNQLARQLTAIARATGLERELLTPFSAVTREGVAEVWSRIAAAVEEG
jgi:GTP-binding protein